MSETNTRGGAKGESLASWADVHLVIKKKKADNMVSMRLDKTRRTAGEGIMGDYMRVVRHGEFCREKDLGQLKLVPPVEHELEELEPAAEDIPF